MPQLTPIRRIAVVMVLAGTPLMGASAQAQAPDAQTQPPPPAVRPDPAPLPSTPAPQRPVDRSVTAPGKVNPLVGLAAFSSDGSKMGTVQSVSASPDGSVKAIHIKTGGFLGFGGKLVAIPEGRFTKAGDNIQLGMTADEVSKLPEVKEQSYPLPDAR